MKRCWSNANWSPSNATFQMEREGPEFIEEPRYEDCWNEGGPSELQWRRDHKEVKQ